jgi:hypothetical protein
MGLGRWNLGLGWRTLGPSPLPARYMGCSALGKRSARLAQGRGLLEMTASHRVEMQIQSISFGIAPETASPLGSA